MNLIIMWMGHSKMYFFYQSNSKLNQRDSCRNHLRLLRIIFGKLEALRWNRVTMLVVKTGTNLVCIIVPSDFANDRKYALDKG